MPAWPAGDVKPTTLAVTVLAEKAGAKSLPVSPALYASLVHADRTASVWTVKFSADGTKLFTAGYPSGVIQVWDVAARKEVRRIETPKGYRGSADYALLTTDWQALYVPVETRKVVKEEKDGKPVTRVEQGGQVRVFDPATGVEGMSLLPAAGHAPCWAKLSPDGTHLLVVERPGYVTADTDRPTDTTYLYSLPGGAKRKVCDGFGVAAFTAGGKTLVVEVSDHEAKTSRLRVLDVNTLAETAAVDFADPAKERTFSLGEVSPDGGTVLVHQGGKKGSPYEIHIRDGRTLAGRGTLVLPGSPDRYGWASTTFTPDGQRFLAADGGGTVHVYDVAAGKVTSTFPKNLDTTISRQFLSPDGKYLAVAWMPRWDAEQQGQREPDPKDLPQPRVTLYPLDGTGKPREFVCPHGFVGGGGVPPGRQGAGVRLGRGRPPDRPDEVVGAASGRRTSAARVGEVSRRRQPLGRTAHGPSYVGGSLGGQAPAGYHSREPSRSPTHPSA